MCFRVAVFCSHMYPVLPCVMVIFGTQHVSCVWAKGTKGIVELDKAFCLSLTNRKHAVCHMALQHTATLGACDCSAVQHLLTASPLGTYLRLHHHKCYIWLHHRLWLYRVLLHATCHCIALQHLTATAATCDCNGNTRGMSLHALAFELECEAWYSHVPGVALCCSMLQWVAVLHPYDSMYSQMPNVA